MVFSSNVQVLRMNLITIQVDVAIEKATLEKAGNFCEVSTQVGEKTRERKLS